MQRADLLLKIKQVYALAILPRILKGDTRHATGNFEKLSLDVSRRAAKSTKSDANETEAERCQRIIDRTFEPNGPLNLDDSSHSENLHITPYAPASKQKQCVLCKKIINKIFGDPDPVVVQKKNDAGIAVEVLQATTAKQNEEQLTQKIEIIKETPLVEASKPEVEGLNQLPKVLGKRKRKNINERDIVTLNFTSDKSLQCRRRRSSRKGSRALDDIAKRCLNSPENKIDERILREIEKLGCPQTGYHLKEQADDREAIQAKVIRKPRRPVEKIEMDFITLKKKDVNKLEANLGHSPDLSCGMNCMNVPPTIDNVDSYHQREKPEFFKNNVVIPSDVNCFKLEAEDVAAFATGKFPQELINTRLMPREVFLNVTNDSDIGTAFDEMEMKIDYFDRFDRREIEMNNERIIQHVMSVPQLNLNQSIEIETIEQDIKDSSEEPGDRTEGKIQEEEDARKITECTNNEKFVAEAIISATKPIIKEDKNMEVLQILLQTRVDYLTKGNDYIKPLLEISPNMNKQTNDTSIEDTSVIVDHSSNSEANPDDQEKIMADNSKDLRQQYSYEHILLNHSKEYITEDQNVISKKDHCSSSTRYVNKPQKQQLISPAEDQYLEMKIEDDNINEPNANKTGQASVSGSPDSVMTKENIMKPLLNQTVAALPKLDNRETLPLSEIMKRVRERNRLEFCKEFQMRMQGAIVEPELGKCGDKPPPCPPPAPVCPPPPPKPCPPKPPCPKPCKPKCPSPCPPPCPPPPCSPPCDPKPKCPPPKPQCPPPVKPCDPCKKSPCDKFEAYDLSDLQLLPNICRPPCIPLRSTLLVLGSQESTSMANEEILRTDFLIKRLQKMFFTDQISTVTLPSEIVFARTFDPWLPIPSWPIHKKQEDKKFVCPKEGCKERPPSLNPPCRDVHPCDTFPKPHSTPKRSFSMVELLF